MSENAKNLIYAKSTDGIELSLTQSEYDKIRLLQSYILEIMVVVDKFCRENGITYYLGEGTLLGAVRHSGFIPWDDDADILMPRKDYEKFLALAKNNLPDGYALDSFNTNSMHWSIPSMVQLTRKTGFEKPMYEGIALYNGPNIDIFPLDYVESETVNRKLWFRAILIRTYKRALWLKTGVHTKKNYQTIERKIHYYYPSKILSAFHSIKGLQKILDRLLLKTDNEENKYLANFASLYFIDKEVFPKEWYASPREMIFEGKCFFAPKESEKVLAKLYGNYMELPPVENRGGKHHFSNFH